MSKEQICSLDWQFKEGGDYDVEESDDLLAGVFLYFATTNQ